MAAPGAWGARPGQSAHSRGRRSDRAQQQPLPATHSLQHRAQRTAPVAPRSSPAAARSRLPSAHRGAHQGGRGLRPRHQSPSGLLMGGGQRTLIGRRGPTFSSLPSAGRELHHLWTPGGGVVAVLSWCARTGALQVPPDLPSGSPQVVPALPAGPCCTLALSVGPSGIPALPTGSPHIPRPVRGAAPGKPPSPAPCPRVSPGSPPLPRARRVSPGSLPPLPAGAPQVPPLCLMAALGACENLVW